jgi:hypothetical protein
VSGVHWMGGTEQSTLRACKLAHQVILLTDVSGVALDATPYRACREVVNCAFQALHALDIAL